jgi:hypothetical protein
MEKIKSLLYFSAKVALAMMVLNLVLDFVDKTGTVKGFISNPLGKLTGQS